MIINTFTKNTTSIRYAASHSSYRYSHRICNLIIRVSVSIHHHTIHRTGFCTAIINDAQHLGQPNLLLCVKLRHFILCFIFIVKTYKGFMIICSDISIEHYNTAPRFERFITIIIMFTGQYLKNCFLCQILCIHSVLTISRCTLHYPLVMLLDQTIQHCVQV